MLIASASKQSRIPPLEPDTYPAICVQIIDIGEQWDEKSERYKRQIMLVFEIPSETIKVDGEEKPRYISATYTLSLSDKAKLRSVLETWRGKAFTDDELKAFDLSKLLCAPCMLSVVQKVSRNGNTYANIGGISKLPKGFKIDDPASEPIVFDLDAPDMLGTLEKLPEWIQERIKQSKTYQDTIDSGNFTEINPNDVPFPED